MTNLTGFSVKGVKGLFHSDWLGVDQAASLIGPQLGAGETGKSGNPLHLHVNCRRIWQVFLTLPRQTYHMTYPLLLVVQSLHSSTNPRQITCNCSVRYYVSHILVKSYENDIIA
jgi:hypothetical protein